MDIKNNILLVFHVSMVGIGLGTFLGLFELLISGADIGILHAILSLLASICGFYSTLCLMKMGDS
tara:strand:- start:352 stop:546 length:195 start_codon:yes stop_codon:yes gene_type:complete